MPGLAGRRPTMAEVLESLPDPVVAFDKQWRYTYVSRQAARALGLNAEEMIGRSMWELFPSDAATGFQAACEQAWRDGKPVTVERYSQVLDRWLESYVYPFEDGATTLWRDITARKRAEQAIGEQRQWVGVTLQSIGDGVIVSDAGGRITLLNPVAAGLTGWTEEEARGRLAGEVFRIVNEKTRQEAADIVARVLRDGSTLAMENHSALIARDGREIPIEDSAAPIRGETGAVEGVVVVFHDVTQKRRAQESLREERERLRVALDASNTGIWDWDLDTNENFWSEELWRLYGLAPHCCEPSYEAWRRVVHPDDLDVAERTVQEAARRATELHVEFRVRDREHGVRWLMAVGRPLRDSEGHAHRFTGIVVDISGRKRAEEALQESRAKLAAAMASMTDAVFISDAAGQFIDFNDAFATFHRFRNREECARSFSDYPAILEVSLPDGTPCSLDQWAVPRALRGEIVTNAEYLLRRRDTGETWVGSYSFGPIRDASGAIAGSVVVARDVTGRKLADEALRRSERLYRAIGESIEYGVWVAGPDGHTRHVSDSFLKLLGMTQEECSARGWNAALHPDDAANTIAAWQECLRQEGRWDGEFRVRGADGAWHPILSRGVPVRDEQGHIACWAGIHLDVSALKRAQADLRFSNDVLESFFDASPGVLTIADEELRFVKMDRATASYFKRTRQELVGTPLIEWNPEFIREYGPMLREVMASGKPRLNVEMHGKVPDRGEETVYWLASCFPLALPEGKRGIGIMGVEITETKKAEERVRHAQKLESLGLLAGGVAHDFNNLLVGVIGNASMAREMLPPQHPAAELMEEVLKTGEKAAHLTRQMLAYSGKGKFLVEPLDLSALIPEMVGLVRPSISKKITLQLELADDLPTVEADRGQIQQVFMNLALNGAESIGSREGRLTVRTHVQAVDERFKGLHPETATLEPGRYVCLEVRDTGCGMDEATKARIFDPFFSTKFTGRGLGLAAVAGILRGHKAAITVTSEPGQGSCFTVLFPASDAPRPHAASAPRLPAPRGAGVVLVVDDERMVREVAKRALERHGYTVLVADSGLSAIEVFRLHPDEIALVVLDLSMPQMSGEEALPALQQLRKEVKVIVSSGYSETETMTLFKGQRVAGFIQKPYTASALAEKVKACLG